MQKKVNQVEEVTEVHLGSVNLRFAVGENAPVKLVGAQPAGASWINFGDSQPLVELNDIASGRRRNNTRLTHTGIAANLRIADPLAVKREQDGWQTVQVLQRSQVENIEVLTTIRAHETAPAIEAFTKVTNLSAQPAQLTLIPTISFGFGVESGDPDTGLYSIEGYSEQLGENRWVKLPVRRDTGLVDFHSAANEGQPGRGTIRAVGHSTWSTSAKLPIAGLLDETSGECVLWQIESNTGWLWEIGDDTDQQNMLSVVLSGPTDLFHDGMVRLGNGESYTTPRAGIAFSTNGFQAAVSAITGHRRATRTATLGIWDRESVVFNDYMNTLNGDPSTEKLLPLIDAAAEAGAEVFCVDCGWYDDTFSDWWSTVGEWSPSVSRFPAGIEEVLDHIRSKNMRLGLWLEPEVVGVNSTTATTLPDDMFMMRGGERIAEHQRYFLDYRSPAVQERMRGIFADLIEGRGIEYFKLDYNVTPGLGFEADDASLGQALRESGQAYLSFIASLRHSYPHVTIESCSSGAMRADPLTLRHFDLQSTSDQQDFRLYPTIAVGAPMSMVPEQAGNWAYVQPWMTDAELSFTLLTGMSGRLYLSGFMSKFSPEQMSLVAGTVAKYKELRADMVDSVPRWPLGFPTWTDPIVVFSRVTENAEYVYIWKRAENTGESISIPTARKVANVEALFGGENNGWRLQDSGQNELVVTLPRGESVSSAMIRIS